MRQQRGQAEGVGRFEIGHQIKLGLPLHRQIGEFDAPNYVSTLRVMCGT
jgi:hypothetical protein